MKGKKKFREEIERIVYNEDKVPLSVVTDRIMDMIEEYPFYEELEENKEMTEEEVEKEIEEERKFMEDAFNLIDAEDDMEELEDPEYDDIYWF